MSALAETIAASPTPPEIASANLFQGSRIVTITHGGDRYVLRIAPGGRLSLSNLLGSEWRNEFCAMLETVLDRFERRVAP